MLNLDALILEFDRGLRSVAGAISAARPRPDAALPDAELSGPERAHAAALMRVNHCGEVCAQALYQGQALSSRDPAVRESLRRSGEEELDHLAWSAARIAELGGHTSLLNPLWYAGAFTIGYAAGRLGDAWNLGFLAETERQVEAHLESHLGRLAPQDARTRAIVTQMKADEAAHAQKAVELGAAELPSPVKGAMRIAARVMTAASYRI
jgi:ubiquinone biosynthesis monooxygenase Coq7